MPTFKPAPRSQMRAAPKIAPVDWDPHSTLERLARRSGISVEELQRNLRRAVELFHSCPGEHLSFEAMLEIGYHPHAHVAGCAWCCRFRSTLHGSREEWSAARGIGRRLTRWLKGLPGAARRMTRSALRTLLAPRGVR
jgi:hypothetical protein